MAVRFECDFVRDWVELLRKRLVSMGYQPSANATAEQISLSFFNVVHRLIEPRPRRVLQAKELRCPRKNLRGFESLLEKIEKGVDLRPHLSTRLMKPRYNDAMLNDWGISHLHLGKRLNAKGFVTRTGPVLYARFEPDTAYLIVVQKHGAWSSQKLIDVLHDNWPEIAARRQIRGVTPDTNLSDEQREKLRRAGVMTLSAVNGMAVALGGGYSTSGLSTRVLFESDRLFDLIKKAEQAVQKCAHEIEAGAAAQGLTLPETVELRLKIGTEGVIYGVCDVAGRSLTVEIGNVY